METTTLTKSNKLHAALLFLYFFFWFGVVFGHQTYSFRDESLLKCCQVCSDKEIDKKTAPVLCQECIFSDQISINLLGRQTLSAFPIYVNIEIQRGSLPISSMCRNPQICGAGIH